MPLSIGASIADAVFARRGQDRQGNTADQPQSSSPWHATLNDIGATVAGGLFIGFAIAPTEEVQLLVASLSLGHELAVMGLSLVVAYAIVFQSGFNARLGHRRRNGLFQRPLTETTMAYVVSLSVAMIALYLFDRVEVGDPIKWVISQTVVLGSATSVGGAAGRLVV